MYIFYDIVWIFLFTSSFLSVFFLYEKFISIKSLSFLNFSNYFMDILNGLCLGLFSLITIFILQRFDPGLNIPFFLLVGLLLLMKKNENVSILASVISFIYYLFRRDINPMVWYLFSVLFFVHFVYIIVFHFFGKKKATKILFILVSFFSLIGFFIIGFIFEGKINRLTLESSLFIIFSLILMYIPLDFGISLSISANILFESNNYVFSRFVRPSLSEKVIGNYISQNKTKYGIYCLFEYGIKNKKEPNNNELRDYILTIIEENIDSKAILFAYQKNIFGFFIPKYSLTDLESQNVIREIQNILFNIEKTFQTIDNKNYFVQYNSSVSLYGRQENTINQLEKNCIFEIKNMNKNKNKISIFDYKKYKSKLINSQLAEFMDEQIDLNVFSNKKLKLYNSKTKEHTSNFIYTNYSDEKNQIESFENMLRINKWKNIFNKFFASEAINEYDFKNEIYYLEYSPFVLDDKFNISIFKEKINKKKIISKNIIWYFSYKDIINKNKFEFVEKHISKNFNIALTDYEKAKISDIDKLNPTALISNKNVKTPSKFKKYKIINTSIDDYKTYDDLDKKWNFEIGGTFLKDNHDFENPTKQSKIYTKEKEE